MTGQATLRTKKAMIAELDSPGPPMENPLSRLQNDFILPRHQIFSGARIADCLCGNCIICFWRLSLHIGIGSILPPGTPFATDDLNSRYCPLSYSLDPKSLCRHNNNRSRSETKSNQAEGYLEIETAQRLSSNERRPHLIIRAKQATVNKVMGLA